MSAQKKNEHKIHPPLSSPLSPRTSLKSSADIPCSHVSKSSEDRISTSDVCKAREPCSCTTVLRCPDRSVLPASHDAMPSVSRPRIACEGWLAGCRGRGEAARLTGSDTEDNNMLVADLCDDDGGASRLRSLPARLVNGVCGASIRRRFALGGATQGVRPNVDQSQNK